VGLGLSPVVANRIGGYLFFPSRTPSTSSTGACVVDQTTLRQADGDLSRGGLPTLAQRVGRWNAKHFCRQTPCPGADAAPSGCAAASPVTGGLTSDAGLHSSPGARDELPWNGGPEVRAVRAGHARDGRAHGDRRGARHRAAARRLGGPDALRHRGASSAWPRRWPREGDADRAPGIGRAGLDSTSNPSGADTRRMNWNPGSSFMTRSDRMSRTCACGAW
jgi:hypothetical protein